MPRIATTSKINNRFIICLQKKIDIQNNLSPEHTIIICSKGGVPEELFVTNEVKGLPEQTVMELGMFFLKGIRKVWKL